MSPNRAGYQEGVVAPGVFAKTGSLALQNTQPTVQPAGIPESKRGTGSPFRVENPVQKPITQPRTIENCSSASNDPLVSGGLISAMYKGESMLRHERYKTRRPVSNVLDGTSRGRSRPYLSAPTPRPPMALPAVICVKDFAHVCKAEPMQKTASLKAASQQSGVEHLA